MVSRQQGGGVLSELRSRVGQEYVLVRHNKAKRGQRTPEVRQFNGRDVETALFEQEFDGTSLVQVNA
jgi:hypothetical protein